MKKSKGMWLKLVSIALAVALTIGMMPMSIAYAEQTDVSESSAPSDTVSDNDVAVVGEDAIEDNPNPDPDIEDPDPNETQADPTLTDPTAATEAPVATEPPVQQLKTVKFHNTKNWSNIYIYMWEQPKSEGEEATNNSGWIKVAKNLVQKDTYNGSKIYTYTFELDEDSAKWNRILFSNGVNDGSGFGQPSENKTADFELVYDGLYSYSGKTSMSDIDCKISLDYDVTRGTASVSKSIVKVGTTVDIIATPFFNNYLKSINGATDNFGSGGTAKITVNKDITIPVSFLNIATLDNKVYSGSNKSFTCRVNNTDVFSGVSEKSRVYANNSSKLVVTEKNDKVTITAADGYQVSVDNTGSDGNKYYNFTNSIVLDSYERGFAIKDSADNINFVAITTEVDTKAPTIDATRLVDGTQSDTWANGNNETLSFEINAKDATGVAEVTYVCGEKTGLVAYDSKKGKYVLNITKADFSTFNQQKITFKAVDLLDNNSDAYVMDMVLDYQAPYIADSKDSICFDEDNAVGTIANMLTFGYFFNSTNTISVTPSDDNVTSGVSDCVVSFVKDGKIIEKTLTKDEEKEIFYAELPDEIEGPVYIKLTDNAGNVNDNIQVTTDNSNISSLEKLMVEDNKPVVSLNSLSNVNTDNYFGKNYADGKLPEISFKLSDKQSDGKLSSGIASFVINDGVNGNVCVPLWSDEDDIQIRQSTDETDIIVRITDIKKSGEITYNVFSTNGETETAFFDNDVTLKSTTSSYKFSVAAIDNSGNVSGVIDNTGNLTEAVVSPTIYCDNDAPQVTEIRFVDISDENKPADLHIENLKDKSDSNSDHSYRYFFNKDTKMVVFANDKFASKNYSGLNNLKVVLNDVGMKADFIEVQSVNMREHTFDKDGKVEIIIPKNFKGYITLSAVDKVNNEGQKKSPYDFIHETQKQHAASSSITFDLPSASYKKIENADFVSSSSNVNSYVNSKESYAEDAVMTYGSTSMLYNSDTIIKINVTDNHSGIKKVRAYTYYDTNDDGVPDKTVGEVNYTPANKSNFSDFENGIYKKCTFNYKVKSVLYSNVIDVVVELTDNSGNTSYDYVQIAIDNKAPVVSKPAFLKTDGTGTDGVYKSAVVYIDITERNTNAAAIKKLIEAKYSVHKGSGKPSVDVQAYGKNNLTKVWRAKITYQQNSCEWDGCQVLIKSLTDNAGNVGNSATGNVFRIDSVAPTYTLTWSPATVSQYMNQQVTATLRITDHNYASKTDAATAGGSSVGSNMNSSANDVTTYTYTFGNSNFEGDCSYRLTSITDKAGNTLPVSESKSFAVDTIKPRIQIVKSSISNPTSSVIKPKIVITDKYLSSSSYTLTRYFWDDTSKITKNNISSASYSLDNIKDDGYYVLSVSATDRASNSNKSGNSDGIFIVNRKGTVYVVKNKDALDKINGKIVNKDAVQNIEIIQYNVSKYNDKSDDTYFYLQKIGEDKVAIPQESLTTDDTKFESEHHIYMKRFVIKKSMLSKTGVYQIFAKSTDVAGNTVDIKDNLSTLGEFTIDNIEPDIAVSGLSEQIVSAEKQDIKVTVTEGYGIKSMKLYLGDKELKSASEEEISTGQFIYTLLSGTYNNIRIVVEDIAGNISELNAANSETNPGFEQITISTNPLVLWYHNTALFIGTIAGALILIALAAFLIIRRRKKNELI